MEICKKIFKAIWFIILAILVLIVGFCFLAAVAECGKPIAEAPAYCLGLMR